MLNPKRYHLDVAGGLQRLLTDLPSEVILLHSPGGHIHFASHTASEIFGEGADVSHSNFLDLVHESDRSRVRMAFTDAAMRKDKPVPMTVRVISTNDAMKWVVLFSVAVRDAAGQVIELHSTLRDVTEQVSLRDRIVENDTISHITNILAKVGGWYHEVGTDRLYWSDEVMKIHEVDDDFVPTRESTAAFYNEHDMQRFREASASVTTGGPPVVVELGMTTAKGNKKWLRVFFSASFDHGTVQRLYGATQDITEIREREVELERLVKELTIQRDLLEEFSHLVSHQLRGPLTNLTTLMDMVHDAEDDQERFKLYRALQDSIAGMGRTLDEVSEAVRLRRTITTHDERISVASLVHQLTVEQDRTIQDVGATIKVDVEELPFVEYPVVYLEAILRQLITNALRFAHADRPLIVDISTRIVDGDPILTVSDNGTGMDLGLHGSRLFRLGSTFHRHASGRGVGLFMVRSIIESLGGEILVQSEPDKGTTFSINLRKYRAEDA